jgi:N-acetylglutamate synthase
MRHDLRLMAHRVTALTAERETTEHDTFLALARAAADGFRVLSMSADGGSSDDIGGAICWYSTSYVPVFNGASILEPDLINRATLSAIEGYFRPRVRPYSVMTLDALIPDAVARIFLYGYVEYDAMPAMWLDGEPGGQPAGASDLWITQVSSPVTLAAFRRILSVVFHLSIAEVNLVLGEKTLEIPHVHHYLGWLDNTPISTASLVLSGDVAGVWNVGTLAEYRRRGVAAALMRHILADARALGCNKSMLLATDDGQPLYECLGYKTLSNIRVFVPEHY